MIGGKESRGDYRKGTEAEVEAVERFQRKEKTLHSMANRWVSFNIDSSEFENHLSSSI